MKNSSGKRYSNDFKERIVKLYLNGHQSMTALSREYGGYVKHYFKMGQICYPHSTNRWNRN